MTYALFALFIGWLFSRDKMTRILLCATLLTGCAGSPWGGTWPDAGDVSIPDAAPDTALDANVHAPDTSTEPPHLCPPWCPTGNQPPNRNR